jgi:hypothetical protein
MMRRLSTGAAPSPLNGKDRHAAVCFVFRMIVSRDTLICQRRTTHQGYAPEAPLSSLPPCSRLHLF